MSERKPLTQRDLAGRGCELHGGPAGELFLHGRCHPDKGTRASYKGGVLTVRCRACKALIAELAVASGAEEALVAALRPFAIGDAGDKCGCSAGCELCKAALAALELAGVTP